jgi:hypothetical protein
LRHQIWFGLCGLQALEINGGEGGIRTPGRGLGPYDGLANRCFRPLSHLSGSYRGRFSLIVLDFGLRAAL